MPADSGTHGAAKGGEDQIRDRQAVPVPVTVAGSAGEGQAGEGKTVVGTLPRCPACRAPSLPQALPYRWVR